jgi:hypothetical protein
MYYFPETETEGAETLFMLDGIQLYRGQGADSDPSGRSSAKEESAPRAAPESHG